MKITIYELLGMIKDGKAPKGVISEGHYYTYNELEKDYYEGMGYNYEYLIKNTPNDRLNDEVEILEKKIPEKLYDFNLTTYSRDDEDLGLELNYTGVSNTFNDVYFKINEIIDYLKSKGE